VTKYEYNDDGRITKKIAANGKVTNITYDVNQRIASVKDDNEVGYEFEYNFDPATQQVFCLTKSPEGSIDEVWMDNTSRVMRHDRNGRTIKTQVNSERINGIINEKGNQIITRFDDFGNPVQQIYPDKSSESSTYSTKFRNLLSHTNRNGVVTKYTYNDNGQQTKMIEAFGTDIARSTEYFYENAAFLLV